MHTNTRHETRTTFGWSAHFSRLPRNSLNKPVFQGTSVHAPNRYHDNMAEAVNLLGRPDYIEALYGKQYKDKESAIVLKVPQSVIGERSGLSVFWCR